MRQKLQSDSAMPARFGVNKAGYRAAKPVISKPESETNPEVIVSQIARNVDNLTPQVKKDAVRIGELLAQLKVLIKSEKKGLPFTSY